MTIKGWCCEHKMYADFNISDIGDHVLLYASYQECGYEGYAWALTAIWDGCIGGIRKDVKFYMVEGSHCSCYGLEGQWKPVEITREFLEKKEFWGYEDIKTDMLAALDHFNNPPGLAYHT